MDPALAGPRRREINNVADTGVVPICGKMERMIAHASRCSAVNPEDLKFVQRKIAELQRFKAEHASSSSSLTITTRPPHSAGSSRSFRGPEGSRGSSFTVATGDEPCSCGCHTWDNLRQKEFSEDLCKLFVACGWAWNGANNPELGLFCGKYIRGASLPDRRKLAGPLLDSAARSVEDRIAASVRGKVATGQCDGWKNIAKTNVVTSVMTVERKVRSHIKSQ